MANENYGRNSKTIPAKFLKDFGKGKHMKISGGTIETIQWFSESSSGLLPIMVFFKKISRHAFLKNCEDAYLNFDISPENWSQRYFEVHLRVPCKIFRGFFRNSSFTFCNNSSRDFFLRGFPQYSELLPKFIQEFIPTFLPEFFQKFHPEFFQSYFWDFFQRPFIDFSNSSSGFLPYFLSRFHPDCLSGFQQVPAHINMGLYLETFQNFL